MAHTHGKGLRLVLAGLAAAAVLGKVEAARAEGDFIDNMKLELGVMGGGHIFAKDLELGVADDATLTSPKNSGMFGLRLGFVLHPMFAIELEGAFFPTADRVHDFRAWL